MANTKSTFKTLAALNVKDRVEKREDLIIYLGHTPGL